MMTHTASWVCVSCSKKECPLGHNPEGLFVNAVRLFRRNVAKSYAFPFCSKNRRANFAGPSDDDAIVWKSDAAPMATTGGNGYCQRKADADHRCCILTDTDVWLDRCAGCQHTSVSAVRLTGVQKPCCRDLSGRDCHGDFRVAGVRAGRYRH